MITCDIQTFEGDCVTFLQAASCGSPNYADINWHAYAFEKCIENLESIGPIRNMTESLQHEFRAHKQTKLQNPSSNIHTWMKQDGLDTEGVKVFKSSPGWEITSQKEFAERDYTLDETYPLSVVVVYSALNSDLTGIESGTNLKKLFPLGTFTRSQLLGFLHDRGAKNPLIIDNSCGGVCTRSDRKERAVVRDSKKAGVGGKRTKHSKHKRNKTKRKQ